MMPNAIEPNAVTYFLAHDDDTARALEALAPEGDAGFLEPLEAVEGLPVERLELYAEIYTAR